MQGNNKLKKTSTSAKANSNNFDVSPGYGTPFWLESQAYHMLDKTECLNFMSKYEGCSNYVEWDTSGHLPKCRCCHENRGNEFFTSPAILGKKSIIMFKKEWDEPSEELVDTEELEKSTAIQMAIDQDESEEEELHSLIEIKNYKC